MNKCHLNTELSSLEGTRSEFNRSKAVIKLGIDVHQDYYVVVKQEGGTNPKPAQRFGKETFLLWAAKFRGQGVEVYAVYEACGFGFGLQRRLNALGIHCYVVCPQKLDERNKKGKDRWPGCQGALLEVGPLCPRQPGGSGAHSRAERARGTKAGHPSKARAVG